jgi:hypothetical protein
MQVRHLKARVIGFVASLALVVILVAVVYGHLLGRMRGITRPDNQARLNALVIRLGVAAALVAALLFTVLCAFLLWRANRPSRVLLGLADVVVLIMLLCGPAMVDSIASNRLSFQGLMDPWVDNGPLIVTLPSTAAVLGAVVFWLTAVRRFRTVQNAA